MSIPVFESGQAVTVRGRSAVVIAGNAGDEWTNGAAFPTVTVEFSDKAASRKGGIRYMTIPAGAILA